MRRFIFTLVLIAGLGLPACGGGGGGSDPAAPTVPGTLLALAVQGQATPASIVANAGTFAAIDTANQIMDVADGGWAAFVTTVNRTIGGAAPVLFVAEPDGTLHEVFATGDALPGGGGGAVIQAFNCVWMCGDGTIYAHVTAIGGPATGVISAQVSGGAVINKSKVVHQGDVLPGNASMLASVDPSSAVVDGTCTYWFQGILQNGVAAIYSAERDGTGIVQHIFTGQVLPGAVNVVGIDAFAPERDGTYLALVVDTGGGAQAVYQHETATVSYVLVAGIGRGLPDTIGTVTDPYLENNPIFCYPNGNVLFIAVASGAAPDHVVLFGNGVDTDLQLARSGDFAVGSRAGGSLTTISMIHQRLQPPQTLPQILCGVTGDIDGIIVTTYAIGGNGLNRFLFNGRLFSGGGAFTGAFAGLQDGKNRAGSPQTGFAFRDTLDDARTGMFWIFPTAGPFGVALSGGDALGGTDTYGSFAGTAHTCENDVLLFTAVLTTAGSGLFRQG